MNFHFAIYMGLSFAYFEAALQNLGKGQWHAGCREVIIAVLYASIALIILDPAELPAVPVVTLLA